jgi:hypothetical protein
MAFPCGLLVFLGGVVGLLMGMGEMVNQRQNKQVKIIIAQMV